MKQRLSGILKAVAKLLIAALLIYWVVGHEWRKVAESISSMNPLWIVLCGLTLLTQMAGTAIRWKALIAPELHVSYYEAFRLTFIGLFANIFVPAGAVGGDIVKAAFLGARVEKGKRVEAAISILVDRIVGLVGLFCLTLVLALIYLHRILALPSTARYAVYLLVLMSIAGLAIAFMIFFQDFIFRWKFASFVLAWADKWMRGVPGSIIRSVAAYRNRWKTLVWTTLYSMLILHPLLMLAMYFPLYGALHEYPHPGVTMTAVAFGNAASALPLTPGGIGTRDLVVKTLLSAWGITESAAVTAIIIYTAMLLLIDLLGGIGFFLPAEYKRRNKILQ